MEKKEKKRGRRGAGELADGAEDLAHRSKYAEFKDLMEFYHWSVLKLHDF